MKSRFFVALCAVFFLAGCSALDTDNTPYEGMQPGDPIPGLGVGAGGGEFAGYYSGTMTAESNTCQTVSDEVGAEIEVALEVLHQGTRIEIDFDDETMVAGELDGSSLTIVVTEAGVKHIYYLDFSEEGIAGSAEAIEPDQDGMYGASCAVYSIALEKGMKPMPETTVE